MDWFKSYHGAPTDTKWLLVAKLGDTLPGIVSAVWWALLDHASQADERGNVTRFDHEAYAAFSGFDATSVARVLLVLRERGLIDATSNITSWSKRNRNDYSTDRVRRYRERGNRAKRDETLGNDENADEMRGDERRIENKEKAPAEPKRKPARRVPTGWEVKEEHRDLARRYAVDIVKEAAKFRDYTFAKGKADWDATFRNWLRKASEQQHRFARKGGTLSPQIYGEPSTPGPINFKR
jgi:hypothetical protein